MMKMVEKLSIQKTIFTLRRWLSLKRWTLTIEHWMLTTGFQRIGLEKLYEVLDLDDDLWQVLPSQEPPSRRRVQNPAEFFHGCCDRKRTALQRIVICFSGIWSVTKDIVFGDDDSEPTVSEKITTVISGIHMVTYKESASEKWLCRTRMRYHYPRFYWMLEKLFTIIGYEFDGSLPGCVERYIEKLRKRRISEIHRKLRETEESRPARNTVHNTNRRNET